MKTDARVRYTKMRIRDAFFDCLERKPLNRITVKELCEMAEINRATFYKHYMDPYDLMDQIKQDCMDHFKNFIRRSEGIPPTELTTRLLAGMQDPGQRILLLCGSNGDPTFPERIADLLYQQYLPAIKAALPGRPENQQIAAYFFLSGGSGKLLTEWIRSGKQSAPEEVSRQLLEMCDAFMRAYAK